MATIKKIVKCDISAAVWPISMKFDITMHISPPNLKGNENLKMWKSKMVDGCHLENRKIAISQKPFGGFWQNFKWQYRIDLQSLQVVQKFTF